MKGQGRGLLRARIDDLDRRLIRLLAARQGLTDAMAVFKTPDTVRDDHRIAAVVARVRREAAARELSPDLAEALWRQLMEASARRQEDRLRSR